MATIYTPDRKLSIDELMMPWGGRLIFRQYIKNKKHKYGVKVCKLCESDGIVMNVKIYSGEPTPDIHSMGQPGAIVLNFMEKFLGKGYQLYTDNFYNSFELVKCMLTQNKYIVAHQEVTVNPTRRGYESKAQKRRSCNQKQK